jgi:hypothetical protein
MATLRRIETLTRFCGNAAVFAKERAWPGAYRTYSKNSARVLDQRDFVFDSQFLAFPVGDKVGIGEGAMGFQIDGFLQALVARPEAFETIVFAHGSS